MSQCTRCPVLEAEIKKQQLEIQRLRRIITEALGVCFGIAHNADQAMKRGGLPRAVYGYHKAEKETAERIAGYLEV